MLAIERNIKQGCVCGETHHFRGCVSSARLVFVDSRRPFKAFFLLRSVKKLVSLYQTTQNNMVYKPGIWQNKAITSDSGRDH